MWGIARRWTGRGFVCPDGVNYLLDGWMLAPAERLRKRQVSRTPLLPAGFE